MKSKMVRFIVSVPVVLKEYLDAKRGAGFTTSGYVRRLLEQDRRATKKDRAG